MKDFIDKCKQYKSWNEFRIFLSANKIIGTYESLEKYNLSFESLSGHFLRFFDERGIIINTYIGFNTCWFHSFSPTNHIKDGHKDRQSALKEGIIKAFSLEK